MYDGELQSIVGQLRLCPPRGDRCLSGSCLIRYFQLPNAHVIDIRYLSNSVIPTRHHLLLLLGQFLTTKKPKVVGWRIRRMQSYLPLRASAALVISTW